MGMNRRSFVGGILGTVSAAALVPNLDASGGTQSSSRNLAADPLRPQYHLLPRRNWMNDPNGPIYWNGRYHMFYQYNPNGAFWGDMHWGHAESEDMIHWKHLPVALAPTPGGPDADGCFTGTAVVQDGNVALLYTGIHTVPLDQATIKDSPTPQRESQCLAIANDPDLKIWTKVPNPVIAAPPPQLEVNGFRDPSPWRQGEWWYTVTACGIANQGGAVLLYRSRDLRNWEFMHVLAKRDLGGAAGLDPFDPWEVWECPEFFQLGNWNVLIYSTANRTFWQSGKLDTETMTFQPKQSGILDYGSYYAAKTQLDSAGNRVVWGWVTEARPLEEYKAAGWAGLMSLPRALSITEDGRLRLRVTSEIAKLRGQQQSLQLTSDEESCQRQIRAMRVAACCGEIHTRLQLSSEPFEMLLTGAIKGKPWLAITYDPRHAESVSIDGRPLLLSFESDRSLELHMYVDSSVIELLANGEIAWTKRFYYFGGTPQDLQLTWKGKISSILSLNIWQITPISSDRLTT